MNVSRFCPICQSDVDISSPLVTVTACGHTFHTKCIYEALKYKAKCPLCRSNLGQHISFSSLLFIRCKNTYTGNNWTIGINEEGIPSCSFPYWISSYYA